MPLRSVNILKLLLVPLVALVNPAGYAQSDQLAGKWRLGLDTSQNTSYAMLEIIGTGDSLHVVVDGGSVNLLGLEENRISFDLDWSDIRDARHKWALSGEFLDGQFNGEITEDGKPVGTWSATPWTEHPDAGAAPRPVDLSGVWFSLSRGTHKDVFDLTDAGQTLHSSYDRNFDDPHLRCVAGGMIRIEDGPFNYEIIQRDDHLLTVYHYFEQTRRIWTDGRDFPDDIENSWLSMGYSIGHWEGSTLVVETRGMKPTIWDANGMPVSSSAVVTERKYLDEEGRLHSDYLLTDPENYTRPIYRHAYRELLPDGEVDEYSCDPHSFYRGMDLEGTLDAYWGRSGSRF